MTTDKQIDFPPLPEPVRLTASGDVGFVVLHDNYSAQQMRDYVAADRAQRQAQPTDDYQRLLGELLAIVHRDGGHYTAANGFKKATEAAIQVVSTQRQAGQEPVAWRVSFNNGKTWTIYEFEFTPVESATIRPLYELPQPAVVPEGSERKSAIAGELAHLDAKIEFLKGRLTSIGDLAHDTSTGPAVHDTYWEIRSMAYEAVQA